MVGREDENMASTQQETDEGGTGQALIVLTRQQDPTGAAVWFVTDQVSQIVPSTTHPSTEEASFTDIFFKNGLRVTVQGSPDEVVQSFTSQPIQFETINAPDGSGA